MAIDVRATITCDMCNREEDLVLKESWRWNELHASVPSIIRQLPRWEFLDNAGYSIQDAHVGDGRILCESCARVFKDTIKRQKDEMDALFSQT